VDQRIEDVAKPDLGAKRQCQECATKFFDLNRQKIVCPKCGSVFRVDAAPSRAAARAAAPVEEKEEAEEPGAEVVSLHEADAAEEPVVAGDDVEIDDDEATDDTFLEEEEEDGDNVVDLIDGDIENDEEP
jgi:uncharacterized protein (TIGR02300 family)